MTETIDDGRASGMRCLLASGLAPWLCLASASFAAADTAHHHAPHVHGVARMTLAAEGHEVLVELQSPAADLVGFERPPRSGEEHERVRLARSNLLAGDAMVRFNTEADCRLLDAEVDSDLERAGQGAPSDGTPAASGHADYRAAYRFECARPARLESAALGIFAGFPALERVLVEYVTPEGQGAAELTPAQPVVSLVPL